MDTSSSSCSATAARHDSILAGLAPSYSRRLIERGYSEGTVRAYSACVAHFVSWNRSRRRAESALCSDDVERFLDDHLPQCRCQTRVPRCRHQARAALRQLLALLREAGTLIESGVRDAVDQDLDGFDHYMRQAKGLAANTRNQRLLILGRFLNELAGVDRTRRPDVHPSDLHGFIHRQLRRWSPSSAQVLAGALRSFLRYRAACGDQIEHLLPAVMSPAHWRLAPLPQTLSPEEISQLARPFPPDIPSVRRAFAMVRCVADIGLRASEVVGLTLEDIDWVAGTIRIGQ